MSSLIVASDLDLMMLEMAIEQLIVPRVSEFDSAVMKKSVVMFRLLDKDWTTVYPQRSDYQVYRGSNQEIEPFNGGVSVVFPIPQSALGKPMENVDLQIHVHRELSKYFELQSSQSVGLVCVDVSDLFNHVIRELKQREADVARGSRFVHPREPVSRSAKDTYVLIDENGTDSGAKITVYLRVSYLGHSVISEIEVPEDPTWLFYAKEESSQTLPYQCREITLDELTGGCWGSETLVLPTDPKDTICCCCNTGDKSSLSKPQENDGKDQDSAGGGGKKGGKSQDGGKGGKSQDGGKGGSEKEGSSGRGKKKREKSGKGDSKDSGSGIEYGDGNNANDDDDGSGGNQDKNSKDGGDDDGRGISCFEKPSLCGREGTCNKKDKKGKYGKCKRPDGEGGNPLACGERRRCALRKSAAGSATVGIIDKKIPCPPPPVCSCLLKNYPVSWSPCTPQAPCTRCQPVYYGSGYTTRSPVCPNYEIPSSYVFNQTGCRSMQVGWR